MSLKMGAGVFRRESGCWEMKFESQVGASLWMSLYAKVRSLEFVLSAIGTTERFLAGKRGV